MKRLTSSTGKEIIINVADFDSCCELKDIIEDKLSSVGIKLDNIELDKIDVSVIINAILKVDSSREFRNAVFRCLQVSLFNNEKITKETFEDVANRADYYPILIECIKVNIMPFFLPLFSMFKNLGAASALKSQEKSQ